MKCIICGKGLAEGLTLYRVNKTGVEGIWVCGQHVNQTDAKIDPLVKRIAETINPEKS